MVLKNKKGLFFTFMAILLLAVILIAFLAKSGNTTHNSIQQSQIKVRSLNAFVKSLDEVLQQPLKASGKQTIEAAQQYMFTQGYIPNFASEFSSIIVSGKYNNELLENMDEFNITNTLNIVKAVATETDVFLTYEDPTPADIAIQHISPWEMNVTINLRNIQITDTQSEATWDMGDKLISTILFVEDFNDPFSLVQDKVEVNINQTDIEQFGDIATLQQFINAHEFLAHTDAPSFLQRMSGDFSSSSYGIESVLSDEGRNADAVPTSSFVDFYYWGTRNDAVASCTVPGFPAKFTLDNSHKEFYTGSPC